jgi:putative tricarboxylic transport membrane protein
MLHCDRNGPCPRVRRATLVGVQQAISRPACAALTLVLGCLLLVTGCTADGSGGGVDRLRIMVPTVPGGGYDVTARTAASIAASSGIADGRVAVFNLAGDQGLVALSRLLDESGNGRLTMLMGLGIVGATIATGSAHRVTDGTPIARLLEEPEAVLVPADSPYQDIHHLIGAWQEDGQVRIGGGSAVGGPDHLGTMQLARTVGIDPRQVRYGTYDGGGALLPALLDGRIDAAVSSMVEYTEQIRSGQLRVLAVSGPSRVAGVDAPTLSEAGIDAVFSNWRGVLAPPGISEPDQAALVEMFADLEQSPEWTTALAENGWTNAFLSGDDFAAFLADEDVRVRDTLAELGLA